MAALVTLTDDQRNQLPTLINNLNFAVRNLNIGQLFVDVLDGTNTRVLETRDKWEIQYILNKLNLGTFHYEFGDLFIDLVEGTKADITQNHKDDLTRVLNKLNMSLTALQVGELAAEAISPATAAPATPPATNPPVTTPPATPKLKTIKVTGGTGVVGGTKAKPTIELVAGDGMKTVIVAVDTDAGATLGTLDISANSDDTIATAALKADGVTIEITPDASNTGKTTLTIKAGSVSLPLEITVK